MVQRYGINKATETEVLEGEIFILNLSQSRCTSLWQAILAHPRSGILDSQSHKQLSDTLAREPRFKDLSIVIAAANTQF